MTETHTQTGLLARSLHESLEKYLRERKERIPALLAGPLSMENCVRMQWRHVQGDLFCNPLNTIWAIPYLSLRKFLEVFEKLGMDSAKVIIPAIPRAARTAFQKEVERQIANELFGLAGDRTALAAGLESDGCFREYFGTPEWAELRARAEGEVRHLVTEYCNTQTGFNDLASSTAILLAAQTFFGDRSLDVFMMGRRWAALWSRQKAEQHFFLGKKIGHAFYRVVHAPAPTTGQVVLATGIALAILAVFSTFVNIVSYPVQSRLGFQTKQLEKLLSTAEDKLLLLLTKGLKAH
jgi:hypothetical protein